MTTREPVKRVSHGTRRKEMGRFADFRSRWHLQGAAYTPIRGKWSGGVEYEGGSGRTEHVRGTVRHLVNLGDRHSAPRTSEVAQVAAVCL